jgi:hypothetical protein
MIYAAYFLKLLVTSNDDIYFMVNGSRLLNLSRFFCSFWFCCSRFSISFVIVFVVFAYFLCLRIIFVWFFAKFVMLSVFAFHRLVVVFLVVLSVRALGLSCSNCSDVSLSQSLTLPRTAHSQFASLNVLPVSYCFYRSKPRRFNSVYLLILILLSGDIHLNPGRVSNTLTLCTLNIHFSLASTIPHEFLITGDFNLHDDNPLDSHAKQFLSALDAANLTQRVNFPTHCNHHTFDLVITHNSSSLCFTIDYSPVSLSDHYPIFSIP